MKTVIVSKCPICSSEDCRTLLELPKLPQTEKFGTFNPRGCPGLDQILLRCNRCTHVFLHRQIDPETLYTRGSYKFRSASSTTAQNRNRFCAHYWNEIGLSDQVKHVVDAGGNDLFLIKLLSQKQSPILTVVDPIWDNEIREIDGVRVIGKSLERFDCGRQNPTVDGLISSHTFEHLSDPLRILSRFIEESEDSLLGLIEIPDWDSLVNNLRFDCIFHQHYHYFNLRSLLELIRRSGGYYLNHCYNPRGTCGGSLLVSFTKKQHKSFPRLEANKCELFDIQWERFCNCMELLREEIDLNDSPVYGYGASLLLATYFYHLRPNFDKISWIFDDDRDKHDTGYENIPVKIFDPKQQELPMDSTLLITSIENQRAIFNRASELNPKKIITLPIS